MSRYCHTHGEYADWRDGCPDCQEAEKRAEERAREAEQKAEERAREAEEREYRRANPGSYECPACKFITLKRDALRCRECTAVVEQVEPGYWANVRAAEGATLDD